MTATIAHMATIIQVLNQHVQHFDVSDGSCRIYPGWIHSSPKKVAVKLIKIMILNESHKKWNKNLKNFGKI